ncbi:hypothetical protein KPATCC21470_5570 [Kitasatospora purpeofusca]
MLGRLRRPAPAVHRRQIGGQGVGRRTGRGQPGQQHPADRRSGGRGPPPDPGRPPRIAAPAAGQLVQVQHLVVLQHRQLHGAAAALVQRGQVRGGDLPDVDLLERPLGQRQHPAADPVAAVGQPVHEAVLLQGAQQPQGGGLVHPDRAGGLLQGHRSVAERAEQGQRPIDRLRHGAPRSWFRPGRGQGPPGRVVVAVRPGGAGGGGRPAAWRWPSGRVPVAVRLTVRGPSPVPGLPRGAPAR